MTFQEGVRVCIRSRPLIQREEGYECYWDINTHQVKSKSTKDRQRSFMFDRVFGDADTTNDVYKEIAEPIVQSALQGFNGTVFAYGQTASGKTYTMLGNDDVPGIIRLATSSIFTIIENTPEREFLLRMSYLEIYNDNLKDLLATNIVPLSIREDPFKNINVHGLVEKVVTSPMELLQYLSNGERLRHMGATNMNDRSSRSHTIFKMIIESRERIDLNRTKEDDTAIRVAQLNFVDLAGSERVNQTGAEGQRFKEGCYINKSLMILGQVINQICKDNEVGGGSRFINFRDSRLTRILQPSLGGNSLTAIICTITRAAFDETESTLRFASSAKNVRNKPIVNEVLSDEALLYRQKKEINELRKKISELKKENELNEKSRVQRIEYEEKIRMLTEMLVSSRPHAFAKKSRRETWCPGAMKMGKLKFALTPDDTSSDSRVANLTTINENLFAGGPRTEEDLPGSHKRVFFDDLTPKNSDSNKRPRMDSELDAIKGTLKSTEEELSNEQSEKKNLQQMLELHENVLEQFKLEKEEDEAEKEYLKKKVSDLSHKIVELERREISRIESDPVSAALQGQLSAVHEQLQETCRENRKLQERCDAETDKSCSLQTSLDVIQFDLAHAKEEASHKMEEYESKVKTLQSQLETSLHLTKISETCDKLEHESSTLKSTLGAKDSRIRDLESIVADLEKKIDSLQASSEKCDEMEKNEQLTLSVLQPQSIGDRTSCLEEAVQQCEILIQEKDAMKQKLDDMMFQLLEKDNELRDAKSKVTGLEEQAQFDHDEKQILFAEERELKIELAKLKQEFAEVRTVDQPVKSPGGADELGQLKELVSRHEKTAKDAEGLLQDSNLKLAEALSEIDELKSTLKDKQSSITKLQADLESYTAMSEISGNSLQSRHDLNRSTNMKEDSKTSEKNDPEDEVESVRELLATKEEELHQAMEDRDSLQASVASEKAEKESLASELIRYKAEKESLEEEEVKQKAVSDARVATLEEEVRVLATELDEMKEKSNAHNNSVESGENLTEELQAAKAEMTSLTERLHSMQSELQQVTVARGELQAALDSACYELSQRATATDASSHDDLDSHERISKLRKENARLIAENKDLQDQVRQKAEALLAENNKELDQLRLLHEADQAKKDSFQVIAQERQLANKEIDQLHTRFEENQQALVKALSEKDIAVHQLNKKQHQCDELQMQLQESEKSHDSHSSIFTGHGSMDQQKLEKKFKQLSFNLDLTQQKLCKSENACKALQEKCKELEGVQSALADAQSRSRTLDDDLNREREALATREKEWNDVMSSLKASHVIEAGKFEERILEMESALREREEENERKSAELKDNLAAVENLKSELERLRQDLNRQRCDHEDLLETHRQQTEKLNLTVEKLTESEERREQLSIEQERAAETEKKFIILYQEFTALKEKHEALETESSSGGTSGEVEELKSSLKRVEEALAATGEELARSRDDQERLQDEFAKAEEELTRLNTALAASEERADALCTQEGAARERVADLTEQLEKERTASEALLASVNQLRDQVDERSRTVEAMLVERESDRSSREELEEKLHQLEEELKEKSSLLESSKASLDEESRLLKDELVAVKSNNVDLSQKVEETTGTIKMLEADLEGVGAKFEDIFEIVRRQLATIESSLEDKDAGASPLHRKIAKLEDAFRHCLSMITTLEKDLEKKESLLLSGDSLLKEANEKIKELEQRPASASSSSDGGLSAEELQEELSVAMLEKKRALNERNEIAKLLTVQEETLKEAESEKSELETLLEEARKGLESEKRDRSSAIADETIKVKRLEEEKEKAEAAWSEVKRKLEESEVACKEQADLVVELKRKLADVQVVLSTDEDKADLMKLLEEQEHLSESEKKFIAVYREYTVLLEKHDHLVDERSAFETRLQEKIAASQESESALEKVRSQLKAEQERSEVLESGLKSAKEESDPLREEVESCRKQMLVLESRLTAARETRKGRQRENFQALKDFNEMKEELAEVSQRRDALVMELEDVKKKLEESGSALVEKSQLLDELNDKFDRGKKEYMNMSSKLGAAEAALQERSEEKKSLEDRLSKAESKLAENERQLGAADLDDARSRCSQLEVQLRSRNAQVAEVESALELHQVELAKLRKQMELDLSKQADSRRRGEENNEREDRLKLEALVTEANEKLALSIQAREEIAEQYEETKVECEDLKMKVSNYQSKDRRTNEMIEELRHLSTEKDAQITSLQEEIIKLRSSVNDFNKELQTAIDMSKQEIDQQSRKRALAYVDEYCQIAKRKLTDKEVEVAELKKKLKQLSTQIELKQTEMEDLKSKLAEKSKKVEEVVEEMTKLKSSLKQVEENNGKSDVEYSRVEQLRAQYEAKINALQEQLNESAGRYERLQSLRNKTSGSSGEQGQSKKLVLSGGYVQMTKLDIQEMEMAKLKQRIKHLEKELAKYMAIEEKRKAENQMLLDRYNKAKMYIRSLKKSLEEVESRPKDQENLKPQPAVADQVKPPRKILGRPLSEIEESQPGESESPDDSQFTVPSEIQERCQTQ